MGTAFAAATAFLTAPFFSGGGAHSARVSGTAPPFSPLIEVLRYWRPKTSRANATVRTVSRALVSEP
jgi:hypothetical protein